eukprot:TRINITY_DN6777_c0_g1_i1.p1 TRINITY_DN6777_c0_g1~~TRINITY_DN6777_c0_g1_i1.p1  ORF type:complete len:255 (+),score=57.59 TRINITY_DN6777_c0_g1_i1:76-765(+)
MADDALGLSLTSMHPDQSISLLVNTFLVRTVEMLNGFCRVCDRKLEAINARIVRVSLQMAMLEQQLQIIHSNMRSSSNRERQREHSIEREPPPAQAIADLPTPHHSNQIGPTGAVQMSDIVQHKLQMYVRMLEVGVVEDEVRNKMRLDGVDPYLLDQWKATPHGGSVQNEAKEEKSGPLMMKEPLRTYVKMLEVGVPKEAVRNKMRIEGVDPSTLDKWPASTQLRTLKA